MLGHVQVQHKLFTNQAISSQCIAKSAFDRHERKDEVKFEMAYCHGSQSIIR